MDESLSTAMKDGHGMNATLESLELSPVYLTDDNSDLWGNALSFLRTNKVLKSLLVDLEDCVRESCLSPFRFDIATMLQENASLENISFQIFCDRFETMDAEEYIALVTVL
jgi:hypothetical protein